VFASEEINMLDTCKRLLRRVSVNDRKIINALATKDTDTDALTLLDSNRLRKIWDAATVNGTDEG